MRKFCNVPKRQGRRDFLKIAGGAVATGAFGAIPLRGWAADPVNIGGLYPSTGSMAQIGQGCVAAPHRLPVFAPGLSDA